MTILNSIFRDICLYARCTIYFHLRYDYMTLHLTRSRDFSSKNCTKRVVASLTLKCVMRIILCRVKRRNIRMAGENTCRRRGRNGVIMPNGTGNSLNFQISGKMDNLWRLSKIFEMSFQKRSVPFHFVPEFPGILV